MVPLDPLVDPSMGLAVSRIQFVEKAVVFSCFSGRSHCMQRTHYTIKEMRLIKSSDWILAVWDCVVTIILCLFCSNM